MKRWSEATLDRALQAAEGAISKLRDERPEVKSTGAVAYAALKAALPVLEAALPPIVEPKPPIPVDREAELSRLEAEAHQRRYGVRP